MLLTQAADRLAELAAKAAPGPWSVKVIHPDHPDGDAHLQSNGSGTNLGKGCGCCTEGWLSGPNARWMAAVSPAVAPHLVAWLRHEAEALESTNAASGVFTGDGSKVAALALARCVLGMEP